MQMILRVNKYLLYPFIFIPSPVITLQQIFFNTQVLVKHFYVHEQQINCMVIKSLVYIRLQTFENLPL